MSGDRRRGDPPHLVRRRAAEAPHVAAHVPVGTVVRVIKIGGRAQGDPTLAPRLASATAIQGARVVIVHGGGDEVSALQRQMGIEPTFVGGRRVTRAEDLDAVRMILSGRVNKRLVAQLGAAGARAVGISGEDGDLLTARVVEPTMGRVGGDVFADATLVADLLNAGWLPVVSPLARDRDAVDGAALNVNGDDAAAAVAASLGADELLFIADVPGVLDDGVVLAGIDSRAVPQLVERGVVKGGMLAKLEAALTSLRNGVRRVRIAGLDGITDQTAGTTIALSPSSSSRESA
jgi:acetylglutamate kinase